LRVLVPLAVLAVVAPACRPDLDLSWADTGSLRLPPADRYPEAPAVLLERQERFLLFLDKGHSPYFQIQRHDVFAILSEKGFDLAAVSIDSWKETEIVDFRARTILPDGTERAVRRDELVDAEGTLEAGTHLRTRRFHFPRVEVGSILEVAYTTQTPGTLNSFWRVVQTAIPIERYTLEVLSDPAVQFQAKAWKAPAPFEMDEAGGLVRVRLALRDVPAAEDEAWRPHSLDRSPVWIFRVLHYVVGARKRDALGTWGSVAKRVGRAIEEREAGGGYAASEELPGLRGAKGVGALEMALRVARERAEFDGFGDPDEVRSLADVLRSGLANAIEKAYLVRAVLLGSGIRADLAFLRRRLTGGYDRNFPSDMWFNHAIVYVPAQAGVPQAIWLDPSCEACAPGQLPVWSRDVEAFVVTPGDPAHGRFAQTTGSEAPANILLSRYAAEVSANGDVLVGFERELRGSNAIWRRKATRGWNDDQWKKDAESLARERLETAWLQASEADRCDRKAAQCRRKLTFVLPSFATADGDRLLVPLGLMSTFMDDRFRQTERHYDLVMSDYDDVVDELRLRPPAGYELVGVPADDVREVPGLRFEVRYEREDSALVVRRSIRSTVGEYPKSAYPRFREVVRAYEDVRRATVEFRLQAPAPAPAPAAGSAALP
jgi:hypothetical protein